MNEIYNAFNSSIRQVRKLCDLCGDVDHFTFEHFPENTSKNTQHVQDKPVKNLSRSSVPDGILIIESPSGPFVVSTQTFSRGTRFGPILAPKSYIPIKDVKLPLIVFSNELEYNLDGEFGFVQDPIWPKEIQDLFSVRNLYLDTKNEINCNWLIHVQVAKYSDEQNLMCYQENDQIFFTSTKDISMGDILKVWYAPSYAKKMRAPDLLPSSGVNICTNIIQQVSFDHDPDKNKILNSFVGNECSSLGYANSSYSQSTEIFLPPVNSLMKNQSPVYDQNITFSNSSQTSQNPIDFFFTSSETEDMKTFQSDFTDKSEIFPADSEMETKFSPENETVKHPIKSILDPNDNEIHKYKCENCSRRYLTKTNFEKHMRSHDLYMCIFCMKMFPNPSELKEHDCFKFKTTEKKFHCSICLKVLSNAWSLQRHMKIHKNVAVVSSSSTEEELKDQYMDVPATPLTPAPTMESPMDETESQQSMINAMCTDQPTFEVEPIKIKVENICAPPSLPEVTPIPTAAAVPTENNIYTAKHQVIEKCIVCSRTFKNPNSLEKHLRNVHTAHVIRPEFTTSIKKSSEYRKIVLNNTKPIKDDVAKLLASKLNKKSQLQKLEENSNNASDGQPEPTPMNTEYHLDSILLQPVTGIDSSAIPNGNDGTVFIISNTDIENGHMFNNAISITKDNEIFISNYNKTDVGKLPKLVPISSSHSAEPIAKCQKRSESSADLSSNGSNSEKHEQKIEHISPKVFIIDKNNESNQKVQSDDNKNAEQTEERFPCDRCHKVFLKLCQLNRHKDVHENLFYFCPFCKKAPVKARSSLRKHFFKEHVDKINIWQASNFMSKLLRKYDKSSPSTSHLTLEEIPDKKVVRKYTKKNNSNNNNNVDKPAKAGKLKKNSEKHCDLNVPKITTYLNETKCPTIINNQEENNDLVQDNNMSMERDDDTKDILNDIQMPLKRDIDLNQESQSEQQIVLHNLFLDSISYSLNAENDFMIDAQPNEPRADHNHSIESYEISDFRNFRNSFDEIQEKLDAELEFSTEPGLGLGLDLGLEREDVDLNDESSLTESESQNSIINNEGTSFMLN